MKKTLTTATLLIATATHPGISLAGTTELEPINQFELLDSNQDGNISVEEATNSISLVKAFARIDSDGDHKLSREEYDLYVANTVKKSG